MEKRKVWIVLLIALVLVLIFSRDSFIGPLFSPLDYPCGDCTPWEQAGCGLGECGAHEMLYTRYCDFPEVHEAIIESRDGPMFSPISDCFSRCAYRPSLCNLVPDEPSNPAPFSGETDVPLTGVVLSWESQDSDGDNLSYDVYFGEDGNLSLLSSNVVVTNYTLSSLQQDTNYFWQIYVNDSFSQVEGPLWNFTTLSSGNSPPQINLIYPGNGSVNIPIDLTFSWEGNDSDGDNLSYELYFAEEGMNFSSLVHTSNESFAVEDLYYDTIYLWMVNVTDGNYFVLSEVFRFATIEAPGNLNPPNNNNNNNNPSQDDCASGCSDEMVGDGNCDDDCNVEGCEYDDGDCEEEQEQQQFASIDLSVSLNEEDYTILPGSNVNAEIDLSDINSIGLLEMTLTCYLHDFEDESIILDAFQENISFEDQISFERELEVPDYTPPGKYLYSCYAFYNGEELGLYSSDPFEVLVSPHEEMPVGWLDNLYWFIVSSWWYLLLILVILGALVFLIFFKPKKKKRRYNGEIDSSNLFGQKYLKRIYNFILELFRIKS